MRFLDMTEALSVYLKRKFPVFGYEKEEISKQPKTGKID